MDGSSVHGGLLGASEEDCTGITDLPLAPPCDPVQFIAAVPVTRTEAAWVRLKGAEAMRQAWRDDGVDVLDRGGPHRRRVVSGWTVLVTCPGSWIAADRQRRWVRPPIDRIRW